MKYLSTDIWTLISACLRAQEVAILLMCGSKSLNAQLHVGVTHLRFLYWPQASFRLPQTLEPFSNLVSVSIGRAHLEMEPIMVFRMCPTNKALLPRTVTELELECLEPAQILHQLLPDSPRLLKRLKISTGRFKNPVYIYADSDILRPLVINEQKQRDAPTALSVQHNALTANNSMTHTPVEGEDDVFDSQEHLDGHGDAHKLYLGLPSVPRTYAPLTHLDYSQCVCKTDLETLLDLPDTLLVLKIGYLFGVESLHESLLPLSFHNTLSSSTNQRSLGQPSSTPFKSLAFSSPSHAPIRVFPPHLHTLRVSLFDEHVMKAFPPSLTHLELILEAADDDEILEQPASMGKPAISPPYRFLSGLTKLTHFYLRRTYVGPHFVKHFPPSITLLHLDADIMRVDEDTGDADVWRVLFDSVSANLKTFRFLKSGSPLAPFRISASELPRSLESMPEYIFDEILYSKDDDDEEEGLPKRIAEDVPSLPPLLSSISGYQSDEQEYLCISSKYDFEWASRLPYKENQSLVDAAAKSLEDVSIHQKRNREGHVDPSQALTVPLPKYYESLLLRGPTNAQSLLSLPKPIQHSVKDLFLILDLEEALESTFEGWKERLESVFGHFQCLEHLLIYADHLALPLLPLRLLASPLHTLAIEDAELRTPLSFDVKELDFSISTFATLTRLSLPSSALHTIESPATWIASLPRILSDLHIGCEGEDVASPWDATLFSLLPRPLTALTIPLLSFNGTHLEDLPSGLTKLVINGGYSEFKESESREPLFHVLNLLPKKLIHITLPMPLIAENDHKRSWETPLYLHFLRNRLSIDYFSLGYPISLISGTPDCETNKEGELQDQAIQF